MPEAEDPAQDLLTRARRAMDRSNQSSLRYVRCELVNGKVRITGTVPSYYLKQLAQEALLQAGIPFQNDVIVAAS